MKLLKLILILAFAIPLHAFGLADTSAPAKIQIPFGNSAGGAYKRTVPVASQIGIQNGAASYTDGFPPLNFTPVNAGGVPPFGQDMNGILYDVSAHTRWWAAGGPVYYDSAYQTAIGGYPKGACVQSLTTVARMWCSTVNNNTSNPDTGGANWQYLNNAVNVTTVDAAADTTTWPMLARSQTGDQSPATDAGLTYNANTNTLTTGTFSGAVSGTTGTFSGAVSGTTGTFSGAVSSPSLLDGSGVWTDFTASRAIGTDYDSASQINLLVSVIVLLPTGTTTTLTVSGKALSKFVNNSGSNMYVTHSANVGRINQLYSVTGGLLDSWLEYR